jgi:hypothetical protein
MNPVNRREVFIGAAAVSLFATAARAAAVANADILSCFLIVDRPPVRFNNDISFISGLEARQPCRVYVPLSWGYMRGFRLHVEDEKGKVTTPPFHPAFEIPPPDMLNDLKNYLFMVPGTIIGIRTTVAAKKIFPARGNFKLRQIYVPEPSRDITSVPYALVAENGPVIMPALPISVV